MESLEISLSVHVCLSSREFGNMYAYEASIKRSVIECGVSLGRYHTCSFGIKLLPLLSLVLDLCTLCIM